MHSRSGSSSICDISHNLSVIEHIAQRLMVIYLGRAVESAPKAMLFAPPLHPYTCTLLPATPSIDPARRANKIRLSGELPSAPTPPGCSSHKRCPHATARCGDEGPELRTVEGCQVARHHAETIAA